MPSARQHTRHGDGVEVRKRDLQAMDATLTHVRDRELFGRAARPIQRLDGSSLRVVEEAERVAVHTPYSSARALRVRVQKGTGAHPPMPQQLGSVTLSAADVATAASAGAWAAQRQNLV